jgi:hypothetical protein
VTTSFQRCINQRLALIEGHKALYAGREGQQVIESRH